MEDEIRQIQMMLREISFYDDSIERVIPDGIYGQQTENSVKSFQRKNNLYETGEVDNDTWDKITEEYNRIYRENKRQVPIVVIEDFSLPIKSGDAAVSLYVIQAMMLALATQLSNLDVVEVTGIYDARTQSAAEKIMIISGLEPKGEIDREFVNALTELYSQFVSADNVQNSR